MAYLDSHGKTLEDYPRPSVAVDTAVLTVADGRLCVVLVLTDGEARLPGTFLHDGETLRDAALRALRDKADISGLSPRQLHVFDAPARDDRGWVLSVAHADAVTASQLAPATLTPVDALPQLKYDHEHIIELAVHRLRADYAERPDPAKLLGEPFTVRALLALHEAVAGERPMRDTFRRTMLPHLVPTGDREEGTVGKPAGLYRRG